MSSRMEGEWEKLGKFPPIKMKQTSYWKKENIILGQLMFYYLAVLV